MGYDDKGNAAHYDTNRLNTLIKLERVYGTQAVMLFCEMNADKYRDRLGKKSGQPIEQEVLKIHWYEKAAAFYFKRLGTDKEIKVNNTIKCGLPWE